MADILIIEDEQDIREQLVKVFHYEGFDARGAHTGRAGIELAKERHPDLIICDIQMPETDGYDVLLELRSCPETRTIPFIFLTAKSGERAFRKGMQLGADDYLTKPFQIQDVLSTVRVRLEKQEHLTQRGSQQLEELRLNLSSTLPHELQTPLTGIQGFAELLIGLGPEHLPPPEKIVAFQREILENSKRLHHLIENYLLYTKLTFMNRHDPPQVLWENTVGIYEPSTALQWVIEEKSTRHRRQDDISFEGARGTCRISEFVISKIGAELLENACKFSSPGTAIRIISTLTEHEFRFSIEDRGRGMSREQLKRIGAFTQFDRDLYEQQGLGLGLAIVQLLAAQHHADCFIDSEAGKGTTVSISFNLEKQPDPSLLTGGKA